MYFITVTVYQLLFLFALVHSIQTDSGRLAYHVLHNGRSGYFLHQILEEVLNYPILTHVFIHTHSREKLRGVKYSPNVTILRHKIDNEVNEYSGEPGMSKYDIRRNVLAVSASLRAQIIAIGRIFEFSMYSEDDTFVRSETVKLWLERSNKVFMRNVSLGFIRVECTRTICRSIDQRQSEPHPVLVGTKKLGYMEGPAETYSGVWIYPQSQLLWLDANYKPFLRYGFNGLGMRESIGNGGAGAFENTFYSLNTAMRGSLLPEVLVMHYGTESWQYGRHWCALISYLPPCLNTPEQFFALAGMVASQGATIHKEGHLTPPVHNNTGPQYELLVKIEAALWPLAISPCSVQSVDFDRSKFHSIASPAFFFPPPIPQNMKEELAGQLARVGYGPWITKAGSTSIKSILTDVLRSSGAGQVFETVTEQVLSEYLFVSFVRNPVERALAAHHQMEIFFHKGWLNKQIERHGLRWWDTNCLNTTVGYLERKYQCSGTVPTTATDVALKRLVTFLEEISSIGFYDQHITPMSYLMATNPIVMSSHSLLFDINLMFKVGEVLSNVTGLEFKRVVGKNRDLFPRNLFPWIFKWQELVVLSNGYNKVNAALALQAIKLICTLYHEDLECFSYSVPECQFTR